jgi:hypothetical protein
MNIYTATYRYGGSDRLDITVKGQDPLGKVFAPTWEMVMGSKNGTLSNESYATAFAIKFGQAFAAGNEAVIAQIKERYKDGLTLVCFCRAGDFCHRYIVAGALEYLGWGQYMGER